MARNEGEESPPFFQMRGDKWVGFDIDLARKIAKRLGVSYESQPAASFDEVVDLVANRGADIGISKLSITLERSKRVRFSKPYVTVFQTLLVNRQSVPVQEDPFTSLAAQSSKRIGALEKTSYIDFARSEFSADQVMPYSDFADMMLDVTERRLDAALVDSARANIWRKSNPERSIQIRTFVARERKDLLAIAVNWEDTHLLAWLDLFLDSIRDDGSADHLYRTWFVELLERQDNEGAARQ